ncbi:hypothetical protein HMPREF0548_1427 [Lactobacillus ultunensis DSM 16047]|uniref:Uncharacterized protein n=1 Tax=Lactobacillus ultunensis DSM 16047 TaxID=525365 RepID=C2EP31_9LACO|nr:hypothetical protein HMPREF0548_1427 [Lactobacillus ultunensis DSM 16047]
MKFAKEELLIMKRYALFLTKFVWNGALIAVGAKYLAVLAQIMK